MSTTSNIENISKISLPWQQGYLVDAEGGGVAETSYDDDGERDG